MKRAIANGLSPFTPKGVERIALITALNVSSKNPIALGDAPAITKA